MLMIMTVLAVLVLGVLIMDCMKTNEYLEEQTRMKADIRKLHYEVCELEDKLRGLKHG